MKNNKICYLNLQVQLKSLKRKTYFSMKTSNSHGLPFFSNLTLYMQNCLSWDVVSLCERT